MDTPVQISYQDAGLVLNGKSVDSLFKDVAKWDERTLQWRALGKHYRSIMETFVSQDISYVDNAKMYESQQMDVRLPANFNARPHQKEALQSWLKAGGKGCVSLPTGAGKTILAMMCIEALKRPTLIVVPTIDLLIQWQTQIKNFLGIDSGVIGGGSHDIAPITVSTYDSAHIHIAKLGAQFGLLVCDECHHLGGELYQSIAQNSIAPFRLGLSATFERSDGNELAIYELMGDLIFESQMEDLVGSSLAPYKVETIQVELTEDEREDYEYHREVYKNFLTSQNVFMSGPRGWTDFIIAASRTGRAGKDAMKSFLKQKKIAQSCSGKLETIWKLLNKHKFERTIIFTNDNEIAYKIGTLFYLPVLTHQTKAKERKKMLDFFREGKIHTIVTSKVLNEGVDVPEASVAIVVSGSGAVREHVQRLGRILRNSKNKEATLYELIAKKTGETFVNKRRREHNAYQRPSR